MVDGTALATVQFMTPQDAFDAARHLAISLFHHMSFEAIR